MVLAGRAAERLGYSPAGTLATVLDAWRRFRLPPECPSGGCDGQFHSAASTKARKPPMSRRTVLAPVALALRGGGVFTGHGRLMERPQQPYFDLFNEKGIRYEQKDGVLTRRTVLARPVSSSTTTSMLPPSRFLSPVAAS